MTTPRTGLSIQGRCQRTRSLQLIFVVFALSLAFASHAQQAAPVERVYKHSQVEVEKALQEIQAYATSRLPVLDGFVSANASTLDRFNNPHYQFRIEVVAQGPGQTLVSVGAKITAWYEGADPSHSQYVVIPSNGRLEEDLLDRLSIYLERGTAKAPSTSASAAPGSSGHAPVPNAGPESAAKLGSSRGAGASDPAVAPPAGADAAALARQIDAVRAQRAAIEQKQRDLQAQIQQLESASKSEVYLKNVAIVKAAQTPVFERAEETSRILFRADPDDEFEIIEVQGEWVHVRLENGGQGWLRIPQLRTSSDASDSGDPGADNFSTSNEEIKPFAGEWAPLKGKAALFVFAQSARTLTPGTLGQSQLDFAKHIFLDGYRESTHSSQTIAGVVVVFLGEKGGVAAATLQDIRRWREGLVSDKVFLERCSFDPPDSFRDAPRR